MENKTEKTKCHNMRLPMRVYIDDQYRNYFFTIRNSKPDSKPTMLSAQEVLDGMGRVA